MILKSLILQGFKSFPDRTEIRFLGGMTAIVGPNGSGKSNISDAIRWVLGEQSSRSLRGAKMEDVIFSGTSKRRAVGFAEVSLILDNSTGVFKSEFVELMVTRRYYRSGESEYFLNKKHCRLRDINELFMDTGLGRDGYSVIGQGRIDEILALKSEDRREIFEEAAGITKFRYRKEESERKLAATEENLIRIRDIYTELENQAGPLAKQAEKAKQYLALRDELRALEVTLWLLDLEKLAADSTANQTASADCAAQLDRAHAAQFDLPEGTPGEMADAYRNASVDKIIGFSRAMFRYWTEEEFPRCFRRMLTLEQYRNAEMGALYQQYLAAGPLQYVTDLFAGLGLPDPCGLAAAFYGPMHLLYSCYDGASDKGEALTLLEGHFEKMRAVLGGKTDG